jgi:hypothetical protein
MEPIIQMAKAPVEASSHPMDIRSGVKREGSFDPATAGKLLRRGKLQYAAASPFGPEAESGEDQEFAPEEERPMPENRRLTKMAGSALAQVEERTQVFSFAGLRNTIGREGLSLDGVKTSSKVSYPA